MRIGSRGLPLSEINVTPLVDVMLVLLIIFMVAAQLMEQGIDVALPQASTSKGLNSSGLTITLTREHVIYLNEQIMTLKELRHELSSLKGGRPILIRADRSAYVSKLVQLWDLCRDAGFREIHIATLSE